MYLYTVIAFFLIVLMTCFCSTVTYIHKTRSKNSFRLPYCGTNVTKFSLRFQGPKIFNSLALKLRMPLLLLRSILNLSHFSWYKHTLFLLMIVSSFSLLSLFFFSFILALFYLIFFFRFNFALSRSAISIFILLNDYFLCSKEIVRA